MPDHPYQALEPRAFWSRAVSRRFDPRDLRPGPEPLLRRDDRVMTAGSCFAANLVPPLERAGFHYLRTERRPAALRVPPENLSYDRFTAAYGNLYTARQLLQLLRRARGQWAPQEEAWETEEGVIDPFRPGLRYGAGHLDEFRALTRQHLDRVAEAFAQATVLVFTLGLTEAWVSTADGAVFPSCPGTVAGRFDPARHGFVNFDVAETVADLEAFVDEVREINPGLRLILTVSPVPLVATATGGHVLVATTYSKSVLRVAAGMVERSRPGVTYFPSYEIVTGPQAPADFFEPDRRNVSARAIRVVMDAFLAVCEAGDAAPASAPGDAPAARPDAGAERDARAARIAGAIARYDCEEAMADPGAARPEGGSPA
jgi:hypothetical protein